LQDEDAAITHTEALLQEAAGSGDHIELTRFWVSHWFDQ
jgi:hypothetical protein